MSPSSVDEMVLNSASLAESVAGCQVVPSAVKAGGSVYENERAAEGSGGNSGARSTLIGISSSSRSGLGKRDLRVFANRAQRIDGSFE